MRMTVIQVDTANLMGIEVIAVLMITTYYVVVEVRFVNNSNFKARRLSRPASWWGFSHLLSKPIQAWRSSVTKVTDFYYLIRHFSNLMSMSLTDHECNKLWPQTKLKR